MKSSDDFLSPESESAPSQPPPSTRPRRFEPAAFTHILDAVPFGLFVLDADGVPAFANATARRILQKGPVAAATPLNLAETYSAYVAGTDDLYPAERMPIVRALAGETSTVTDMEIRRGVTSTYLEVSAAPVLDAKHRVIYAVAAFHDITASRAIEGALQHLAHELAARVRERTEQLEEATRALRNSREPRRSKGNDAGQSNDTASPDGCCAECLIPRELERARESAALAKQALTLFIANFSHELRTPLNHIIGFSDLIESKVQRGVTLGIDKHAENIRRSGASLLDTLNKIITIAEVDSINSNVELEIVNIDDVIREVASSKLEIATRNNNRLDVESEGLGLVQSDVARVRTALSQIVENACKHCRNGIVTVKATRTGAGRGSYVDVAVSDSGPGIDRARADHLVAGNVAPGDPLTVGGLGLGIPLAAQALRAVGGTLTYDTEPLRGTRFVLRIPTFTSA